ncbi:MAG: Terminase [Actinomycetota bacterium]|nr:Terminase [Actinomycetota bacterium]
MQSPFIRCLATEEQQAGNTYDNVYYNLKECELGADLSGDAAGLTRTFLPGGGEIRPSTSGNASKDGGKETFVVVDESHLLVLPEHQRMVATVRRNLGKRRASEPWSLETSTMYAPGEDSVAEKSHAYASQIAEGKVRAARLLWDHREAPADVDMGDPESLEAALREVYGDFWPVMDIERIMHEIWDPRSDPSDSRRFWLNQRTSSADSWLTQPEWAGCADAGKVVADRDLITLGFDGSRSRARGVTDATALIGCRVSDGHLFEVAVWEQPQGVAGNGWQVPTTEVDAAVRQAFARWDVCAFYCDPAKWETWVAAWERDFGTKLRVKASRDHPCEWWMSSGRSGIVVRALEQMHSAVVDRELTHDGSFVLTRHVLNARRHPTRSGIQIRKEHPDSPRKIDAAVAAVLAWQGRLDAVAGGVSQRRAAFAPRRII